MPAGQTATGRPPSTVGGWSIAYAAGRVGITPSTLRSWEQRYGIRPTARTDGGHRRYTVADIAALQQVARLIDSGMPAGAAAATLHQHPPTPPRRRRATPRSVTANPSTLAARFTRAGDGLDSIALGHAAEALLDALGVVGAWTEVFAPYLIEQGQRWQGTGTGIECEHLAVAVLHTVLDRHARNRSPAGSRAQVLLSATANEGHTLPLFAAAAALADRGIGTRVLGSLPGESVRAAASALTPSAVLVWSRSKQTTDSRLLSRLATAVPVVCAAGPGWTTRRLPAAAIRVNGLAAVVELLDASLH